MPGVRIFSKKSSIEDRQDPEWTMVVWMLYCIEEAGAGAEPVINEPKEGP